MTCSDSSYVSQLSIQLGAVNLLRDQMYGRASYDVIHGFSKLCSTTPLQGKQEISGLALCIVHKDP